MRPPLLTCVVLAAGTSSRMGFNKLSVALADGSTLLDRALHACAGRETIVVLSPYNHSTVKSSDELRIVLNAEPERGMTHSLRLAERTIAPERAIAVLPADLPGINAAIVDRVVRAAAGADVTFPQRSDGTRGHPVVFSPRARRRLCLLAEGDTLRALRDDATLLRRIVSFDDDAPFEDVDEPGDFPGF